MIKQEDWLKILDYETDLIKSVNGRVHSQKGRSNNFAVKDFAKNYLGDMKDALYDALSHHASGYNHYIKKGNTDLADRHMRLIHQYVDLAERLQSENPKEMNIQTPADPQHWEQNTKTIEGTSTPNDSALHGWRLNQQNYSHLRNAPHAKFAQRIAAHGHNKAFPLEKIRVNGKFLDIDDKFHLDEDGDPLQLEGTDPHIYKKGEKAKIRHHLLDYHPLMRPYAVHKRVTPYYALSAADKEKISNTDQEDSEGNKFAATNPDKNYTKGVSDYFKNDTTKDLFEDMMNTHHERDLALKDKGGRGFSPHSSVHGHLDIKPLNLGAYHKDQKEQNSGKSFSHIEVNPAEKVLRLNTNTLKGIHQDENKRKLYTDLVNGYKDHKIIHKETGEEIKGPLHEWYPSFMKNSHEGAPTEAPTEVSTEAPKSEAPKTSQPKFKVGTVKEENLKSEVAKVPESKPQSDTYSSKPGQTYNVKKPKQEDSVEPKKSTLHSFLQKTKKFFGGK